ncbi:MAG: HD domain-containing protein [Myxococcota bacterium]
MPIQIRDPIHGSIDLSVNELKLIDHRAFQRLRDIKQLGFADLAFPGATHSRYIHSLGAMAMATRVFDALFKPGDLDENARKRMRQAIRLAAMLHDLGHAPLSHSSEIRMPSKKSLGLEGEGRASHEDYTYALLTDSSFSKEIERLFADVGVSPADITTLDFKIGPLSYQPLMKQIISSECDADRMDYLQRDSFYCGVNYGKFDADWLVSTLVPIEIEGAVHLGIRSKGMFSFEDFLLSRYHMFASVYLHHTPVIYEKMLQRYFEESEDAFSLPSDLEAYIQLDDVDLQHHLRISQNPWAKRIVAHKPYALLADEMTESEHRGLCQRLETEGIDYIQTQSKSAISKYFDSSAHPLYVLTKRGEVMALEAYTELFSRYQRPAQFNRIYVAPNDKSRASQLS